MADLSRSLEHSTDRKDDDAALQKEAEAYLAKHAAVQLVAELGLRLRQQALPWWSPEALRETWSAQTRMRWLAQRPDIRQGITTRLTGLAPKAARKKAPDFQSALIDSVIDDGDIAVAAFEEVFSPVDMAVYGPAAEIWRRFHERMPWNDDRPPHQELVAWLIKALLADKSSLGPPRRPILTPWDVRTAIDGKVWHARLPIDIRIAIDEARLQQERAKPSEAFHASHELAIAVPEIIAESIPLKDLLQVVAVAERALGFDPSAKGRPEADAKPRPAASVPPPGAAAGPRLGDLSPKAETPGATSGGQMATASGDAPLRPAIPPRSTPAPPPVAAAVAAFAPPPIPPHGGHPLPHPPPIAAPLRASAPPPATPSTPPGPRAPSMPPAVAGAPPPVASTPPGPRAPSMPPAVSSAPPPVASAPPPVASAPPAKVSAPQPVAAAPDDEPEDLERTNPWAVPHLGDLGLDDEELRKLGEAHAVADPPQAGRAMVADPPQAGRAAIADPPTVDPALGGGKRRKSGKAP